MSSRSVLSKPAMGRSVFDGMTSFDEDSRRELFLSSSSVADALFLDDQITIAVDRDSKKLFGRAEDFEVLRQAYRRVCMKQESAKSEILFLSGTSGCGKTALVERFQETVVDDGLAFFATGKYYDQLEHSGGAPFSAIVAAAEQLCQQILTKPDILAEVQSTLKAALGAELDLLSHLIPSLSELAGSGPPSQSLSQRTNKGTTHRVRVSGRTFLNVLSTPQHPIVMFIDDLHWGDEASLMFLQSLMKDPLSANMLIICAYRFEERDTIDWLLKEEAIPKKGATITSPTIHISTLSLHNLELRDLELLIRQALHMRPGEDSQELAELVRQKTDGNPFFVLQYLDLLVANRLLKKTSVAKNAHWDYQLEDIRVDTDVSENVVQVLKAKIERLPKKAQGILTIASFLGYSFSLNLLENVVAQEVSYSRGTDDKKNSSPINNSSALYRERIIKALSLSLKDKLLEKSDGGLFKFSHDTVQQTFYSKVKYGEERELMHIRIGRTLWKQVNKYSEEWLLYLAADNMNRGASQLIDAEERCQLANLNLTAAKLAAKKLGFQTAIQYCRTGISFLDERQWDRHYRLCLDLHNTSAELEHCTGNFVRSNIMVAEVHRKAHTLADQLPAFFTEVSSLGAQGNFEASITLAVQVLRKLGEPLPRRPGLPTVGVEVAKARASARGLTDEEILHMPLIASELDEARMSLLSYLSLHTYLSGDSGQNLYIISLLRLFRRSFRRGLSKYSGPAFAGYAVVSRGLGKHLEARRFANLALSLAVKTKEMECRTNLIAYSQVLVWEKPMEEGVEILLRSHQLGLNYGDHEFAYFAAVNYVACLFYQSLPLHETARVCQGICTEMEECDLTHTLNLVRPSWQLMLNLLGRNHNPAELVGDVIRESTTKEILNSNHGSAKLALRQSQAMASLWFADMDQIAVCAPLLDVEMQGMKCIFLEPMYQLNLALLYMDLYKKNKQKRYLAKVRKISKKVDEWATNGMSLICHAPGCFLAAELAAVKNSNTAEVEYSKAIAIAREQNLLGVNALCNERLARVLLEQKGKERLATRYMVNASALFNKWGAVAKVKWITNTYGNLLKSTTASEEVRMNGTANISSMSF